VADCHDTSVAEIERTYGYLVADHAEEMIRGAQIDISPAQAPDKVVPLKRRVVGATAR
jgi:hypothetical protein